MSARPRMTVRLSPSRLHQVAWLANRAGWTPAEYARVTLVAWCDHELRGNGAEDEWRRDWNEWLQIQAGGPGKAETPDQRDYDRLGEKGLRPTDAIPDRKYTAETLPDPAREPRFKDAAGILAREPHYERESATIIRSFGPDGRKRRI